MLKGLDTGWFDPQHMNDAIEVGRVGGQPGMPRLIYLRRLFASIWPGLITNPERAMILAKNSFN